MKLRQPANKSAKLTRKPADWDNRVVFAYAAGGTRQRRFERRTPSPSRRVVLNNNNTTTTKKKEKSTTTSRLMDVPQHPAITVGTAGHSSRRQTMPPRNTTPPREPPASWFSKPLYIYFCPSINVSEIDPELKERSRGIEVTPPCRPLANSLAPGVSRRSSRATSPWALYVRPSNT